MVTDVFVHGKELINSQQLDAGKHVGRQVHTKVVEVRVLPSRGSNHIKVTGNEAAMLMCGRKADRRMLLSGWLALGAAGVLLAARCARVDRLGGPPKGACTRLRPSPPACY